MQKQLYKTTLLRSREDPSSVLPHSSVELSLCHLIQSLLMQTGDASAQSLDFHGLAPLLGPPYGGCTGSSVACGICCGCLLEDSCLRNQSVEGVSPGQESDVRMGLSCKAAELSLSAEQHSGAAEESHTSPSLAAHILILGAHCYFCDCAREECCISYHHFHMKKRLLWSTDKRLQITFKSAEGGILEYLLSYCLTH